MQGQGFRPTFVNNNRLFCFTDREIKCKLEKMTAALALLAGRGAAPVADLPFEHFPGRILLKATLNGKPAAAALDSGASLTVADERIAMSAGAVRGTDVAVAGGGANPVAGWRPRGLSLALEGSALVLPVALAVPLDGVNARTSHPLAAIVGCDLFRRYIVEVDYVHTRLRLFDPESYEPPKGYGASPLRLAGGRPVVQGSVRVAGVRADDIWMLVDSGESGGIDLGDEAARQAGLGGRIAATADERSAGLGGTAKTQVVLGASGRVGSAKFSGGIRVVSLSEKGQKTYDAKVGDDFLRHFDVVFDLPHSALYLRRNGR